MPRVAPLLCVVVTVALLGGCGDSSPTGGAPDGAVADAGTDALSGDGPASGTDGASAPDTGTNSPFNPENPGYHFFYSLGTAVMMGQTIAFGVGGFLPTAREDFDPPTETVVPLDDCAVSPGRDPAECATSADCFPEQQCLPEKDSNGSPIPGSEHCVTPRSPLDMGPFQVDGFADGALTFDYNPGQEGAYTTASPGDGQIPVDQLVYDSDYTISGDGDAAQGLGPISGSFSLPPELVLTAPAQEQLPIGVPGVRIDPTAALTLTWSGSDPTGEITISLAGGGAGGQSIVCRAQDDGEFVIPADMVQAAGLADFAFFNILTMERSRPGTAAGEGLTYTEVGVTQMLSYSVAKQQ